MLLMLLKDSAALPVEQGRVPLVRCTLSVDSSYPAAGVSLARISARTYRPP